MLNVFLATESASTDDHPIEMLKLSEQDAVLILLLNYTWLAASNAHELLRGSNEPS